MAYRISTTKTWYETKSELETTFDKWGVRDFQVVGAPSGNRHSWNLTDAQRTVTVRFLHRSGNEVVLTMRAQPRPEDNLRVLYLGIESLRLNEARGISDVVREALLQLPAPPTVRDPFEVLGVRPDAPAEVIEASYRALSKQRHPDHGGSDVAMRELNDAYERVRTEGVAR